MCPYSFDVPGGVQFHVRDLSQSLRSRGHEVGVLVPAESSTELPEGFTSAGGAIPIRYNGSVARLSIGPAVSRRTDAWLSAGDFDVVHIHEPFAPSLGMMALRHSEVPIVATFHSSQTRSRALEAAEPWLRTSLERISARIAVSEDARRTVVEHLGGDAMIIPNGVFVDTFASAHPHPPWKSKKDTPTIAFLGRLDEPRKGLAVLLAAVPELVHRFPGLRVLVAGRGDFQEATADLGDYRRHLEYLGEISDDGKSALLKSVDCYVAPQLGGESFGIVLVEAMSAGTTVVASDLVAFRAVVADGQAGFLFRVGSASALAQVLITALTDEPERARRQEFARSWVRRYDWSNVTDRITDVYQVVASPPPADSRFWWSRLRRRGS